MVIRGGRNEQILSLPNEAFVILMSAVIEDATKNYMRACESLRAPRSDEARQSREAQVSKLDKMVDSTTSTVSEKIAAMKQGRQ